MKTLSLDLYGRALGLHLTINHRFDDNYPAVRSARLLADRAMALVSLSWPGGGYAPPFYPVHATSMPLSDRDHIRLAGDVFTLGEMIAEALSRVHVSSMEHCGLQLMAGDLDTVRTWLEKHLVTIDRGRVVGFPYYSRTAIKLNLKRWAA